MPVYAEKGHPGGFALRDGYRTQLTGPGNRAGIGSVEELRIPARNFSGMGLRLLDVERRLWADHWVNARSGVLTPPPCLCVTTDLRAPAGWHDAPRWPYACALSSTGGPMKTLTATALACAFVLLSGCEHTPPTLIQPPSYAGQQVASVDAAAASGIVCTREIPTGLRQTVTRCRNTAEVERRRELDRSWAETLPVELPEQPR